MTRSKFVVIALLYGAFAVHTFAVMHKISNKLCISTYQSDPGCHDGSITWAEAKDAVIWPWWEITS